MARGRQHVRYVGDAKITLHHVAGGVYEGSIETLEGVVWKFDDLGAPAFLRQSKDLYPDDPAIIDKLAHAAISFGSDREANGDGSEQEIEDATAMASTEDGEYEMSSDPPARWRLVKGERGEKYKNPSDQREIFVVEDPDDIGGYRPLYEGTSAKEAKRIARQTAKRIGRGVRVEVIYSDLSSETYSYETPDAEENPPRGRINQKDYKFYIVADDGTGIESGWSYREDAVDHLRGTGNFPFDPKRFRILSKKTLLSMGRDPDDDLFWFKSNPAGLTAKGERMYGHVKKSYAGDPRAKEIAARTVYARAKAGAKGLKKNPAGSELFLVLIKDRAGQLRGSLTPDEFRRSSGCPKTAFLDDCVKQWNAYQSQQGYEDRASVEFVEPKQKRRRKNPHGRDPVITLEDLIEQLELWNDNTDGNQGGEDVYVAVYDEDPDPEKNEWTITQFFKRGDLEAHKRKFGGKYAKVRIPGHNKPFNAHKVAVQAFNDLGLRILNPASTRPIRIHLSALERQQLTKVASEFRRDEVHLEGADLVLRDADVAEELVKVIQGPSGRAARGTLAGKIQDGADLWENPPMVNRQPKVR